MTAIPVSVRWPPPRAQTSYTLRSISPHGVIRSWMTSSYPLTSLSHFLFQFVFLLFDFPFADNVLVAVMSGSKLTKISSLPWAL